jgi:glycosyltransferase involved in cell wall biosynthesis
VNAKKISLTIHSASKDELLLAQHGLKSAFGTYIECLNRQTMRAADFELVFVDTFWPDNRRIIAETPHEFVIKYVPCVHDYWLKRNLVGIASAKNSALLFAEGELVVSCDDSEIFPPRLLQRYWKHYREGYFAHAFHRRFATVRAENGSLVFPIQGDESISDSRRNHVRKGICRHQHGGWLYAGSSFALADALAMNGFNERLDGCKSLEDCEFGCRLQNLGRRFVLDPECFIWIVDHPCIYRDYLNEVITKENYGFIVANQVSKETRANHRPLRQEEIDIIDQQTLKFRQFSIDFSNPEVTVWVNYPTFNLEKERTQRLSEWYAGKYR